MTICIEGPSGAGKSTLAGILHKAWDNFQLCPTVDQFLGSFPVCHTEDEVERNFSEFIQGEERALDFMRRAGGNWIQDRNWVSQITFLEAIELMGALELRTLKLRVLEWLGSGKIQVPSTFIYMRCPPGLTATRRRLRGTTEWGDVPPWVSEDLRIRFRELRYQSYEGLFRSTFPEALVVESERGSGCSIQLKADVSEAPSLDSNEIILRLRDRILS